MIEERFSNEVNARMNLFAGELLEDENGNLYISIFNRAIGYDANNDRLIAEAFGVFERLKQPQNEE